MRPCAFCIVVGLSTLLAGCGGAVALLRLPPERQVVLRVGARAALDVPTEAHYSIGGAGNALILEDRKQRRGVTTYVYRAMQTGQQTIVATPIEPGPSQCISCVTVHYFVRVE